MRSAEGAGGGRAPAIVVVGGGPRGLAVLGRLIARARDASDLTLHLIDPFETGRVWRDDQSPTLLMNSRLRQATIFADAGLPDVTPLPGSLDFREWVERVAVAELPDPDRRAEAMSLGPDDFPTRALFGGYLRWCRRFLAASAAPGVRLLVHRATAMSLTESTDRAQHLELRHEEGGEVGTLVADAVVLATGHTAVHATPREAGLAAFAAERGLHYVPPSPAIDVDWDPIAPGTPVALLGTGLNFYDCVALLTEGRGGKFVRSTEDTDGRLRYLPSGREPRLMVGSGRGIPYLGRALVPGAAQPVFLDAESVAGLVGRRHVDFAADIWPSMVRDLRWAYYSCLSSDPRHRAVLDAYRSLPAEGPAVDELFRSAFPGVPAFDLATLLDPVGAEIFADQAALDRAVVDVVRADLAESLARPRGRVKAVGEMLAALKDRLRTVVASGALDGASQVRDVDGWFGSVGAYLAAGPPALRLAQLLALADAGLVGFLGSRARVRPDHETGRFAVTTANLAGERLFEVLVDARLHGVDLRRTASPLLSAMTAAGLARPHDMTSASGERIASGGLDVDRDTFGVVGADGVVSTRRFAYGIPIEPIHWNIANLPQPGKGHPTIRQADAIARAALGAVRKEHP
ncbi:FAD/NAD(P)-binding protein [Streptomyces sp. NPDC127098]|uniref:FAD/NAD(P)-binding protein n=1 Tax=Streptomyces sp. NPDC127098 TaxID=3347137 RepID=UPI003648852A